MEAIGLVLLKSAAWLTGFALVFLLVLRNERFFTLNRLYLLAGITASLIFPFYTFHYLVVIPSDPSGSALVDQLLVGGIVASETSLPFYYWIYFAGIAAFLLRLLFQTWKIIRKLHETGFQQTGVVKLVRTSEYSSSFSFFSYVFVNPSTSAHEMEEIMNHEREHIQQRHWFDLLLVELICIVQWFNPFAWIYAHLVRQNHEYLADEKALQRTVDPAVYQAALLNQLLGAPVLSLTNSFSYSLNKKRFKMMKKKIDSPFRKFKMLLVLPLIAMLFYAFAVPEYQYDNAGSAVATDGKTTDVKGQVVKTDGTPLHGTSVILRGSNIGMVSDPDGNFELKGVPANGELVFSFVGFKTVVQQVSNQPMKIVMEVGKVEIDQVTVVGNETPSSPAPLSLDLTKELNGPNPPLVFVDGSLVTKANTDKINSSDIESINVLKDKSAVEIYGEKAKNGVVLIKTKAKSESNSDSNLKAETQDLLKGINGANPPLYILDGAETDKVTMNHVSPKNIERMFVLKDPSFIASYGEKGKNGVIMIYTKEYALKNPDKFKNAIKQMIKPAQRQDGVYIVVEEMPEFPGGEKGLRSFIAHTVKYPADAIKEKIQGKVFVTFVVKSDGTVGDAKIARGVHPLLDKEAIRVINLLPTWKPGKQRGVDVNVAYTIPVQFALDGGKSEKKVAEDQANAPQNGEKQVFVVVELMPEFPGGEKALRSFIAHTVKYPADAIKENIQGKVFVTFTVKSDGTIGDAKIARGVHPSLDKEAIRVINLLPAWKPGKQRGQAVNVAYTIPVQFALDGGKGEKKTAEDQLNNPKNGEEQVFVVVEEMPQFVGGFDELVKFLGKEVKYPEKAKKENIQGKVFVSFVVSSTGKVEQAKIERGVDPSLDAEALRVVNQMPDWTPGKQRGQAVSVAYTMPIMFKLQ